jgi:ATP-dependent Clp protease ATP-binding subunit ClpA
MGLAPAFGQISVRLVSMSWFKLFWKRQTAPAAGGGRGSYHPTIYTPRAQQVLALARREAERLQHNFVGTEHLLLGLIKQGQGVAVNVLRKVGLDPETIRLEVEKMVGRGADQTLSNPIPYTPRVKRVLAFAAGEASALQHTYLGTEHILLGLLREGDGVAPRVLKQLGVDADKTRLEILKELEPNFNQFASQEKPQGTEPLGKDDFRCFGCGGVIHREDQTCPKCGWSWR